MYALMTPMGQGRWRRLQNTKGLQLHSSPLDKMAAILADYIFKCTFLNEKFCILIQISLFVLEGSIHNNPLLGKITDWRQMGDKPLSEPMMTQFTDAYARHKGEMSSIFVTQTPIRL